MRTEQQVLHSPPSTDGRHNLALPSTTIEILLFDSTVTSLNLHEQTTLRVFPVAKDFVRTDVVGKNSEEQRVLAVFAEKGAETGEVGTKKRVGLSDSEVSGESLALVRLDAVSPADIGVVLADVVPTLVVLDDTHRPLERRQAHDGVLRPNVERRERQ